MAQADTLAITVHDYMAMPEGPPYYQLIEGELFMSPSPHWRHQKISGNIEWQIQSYLRNHDIGQLFHAPLDVIINETNVYQPDVLFFRHRNSKASLGNRCVEGAPDFVVEILSKSTLHLDKDLKLKLYAKAGVKELWFVDPIEKSITVFHFEKSVDEPIAVYRGDETFTSPIFPSLTFAASEIFRGI
jgi:Uma2 family endonuclease